MLWVVLAFVGFATAGLPFEARIGSDVQAVNPLISSSQYHVDFSLTNIYSEPLTICTWGTPLDKSNDVLRADMFKAVSLMGEQAPYTGILMKRRPVTSDFVTLQPGQTIHATVDLLEGYWFPAEGHYTVSLRSYIYVFLGELEFAEVAINGLQSFELYDLLSTESLTIYVSGVTPDPFVGADDTLLGAVTINANCNSSRANDLRTADTNSGTLISRVENYLGGSCNGGKYVEWMGQCDSNRYSTVRGNFNRIRSRHNAGYRADCNGPSCSANTYAYVHPNDSTFTVYVCGAFWNAPLANCNWDSKPGTIIHELSHFTSVAGTSDYAYGTTACRNLAIQNPANAIRNADNHEYLSESCP